MLPPDIGRVIYEGELGIVIGRNCKNVSVEEAQSAIFGYTCVNDITALEVLTANPSFPQWTRAKGFDGFGVIGPVIQTDVDWHDHATSDNCQPPVAGHDAMSLPAARRSGRGQSGPVRT